MSANLDKACNKVFDFIVDFMLQNNYPPSIQEIAEGCSIKSRYKIADYMDILAADERIKWERNKARTIQVPGIEYIYNKEEVE